MTDPGASAGEVHVDVLPNVDRFANELRAKLKDLPNVKVACLPDVSGFRKELQTKLAGLTPVKVAVSPDVSGFRKELQAKLAGLAPVKVSVNPDVTGFRKELAAKLAALTPVKVSVTPDTTGFKAELRAKLAAIGGLKVNIDANLTASSVTGLKAALAGVTGANVKVDVNITDALANILKVEAALKALPSRVKIDLDVDDAAGLARIAAFQTALSALHAPNPTLNVNTGNSANRVGLLITAIAAIGPAAIPAAAAASAALVSIGNAAIAAVAGVGVAVLALSGIGGAVKAMGAAQAEQTKAQAALIGQDSKMAGGADQVKSALASLANTRANAADAARRSAESIANAERDLSRAQRDALDVQQDLTRAREEARQALEDLDSQVANNALSIRQANFDLADAAKALQAVQNDPESSRRRQEAQLAYDEARQHLDDLTVRQGRLATEQTAAQKAGIEGSTQVVEAQKRIAAAQEKVVDAERAVKDARIAAAEQARQSAFSIAQAQQAVISAQRSAAQSAVSAASTGGAAFDTLRDKMAQLSPAGQGFARFIFGLKDDLLSLRRTAETGFLPGLQRGLQAILVFQPQIDAFVGHIAAGMGRITEAQLKAFGGAEWRPFFTYLNATAVPTLNTLFTSAGNVARGLGSIVVAFAPFTSQFNSGMVSMSQHFADWSAKLGGSNGFREFLSYVQTRGPQVLHTIDLVLGSVTHLLQGIAPVGDVVLSVLRGLSGAINAIPLPVIALVYGGFVAWRVAGLVVERLAGAVVGVTSALSRVGAVSATTATRITGMASSFAGPLTAALAIAAVGIGFFLQRAADAKAKIDQLKSAATNYADALKNGITPASLESARAVLAQSSQLRGLVTNLQQAGISQRELVDGLNGDQNARRKIIGILNEQIAAQQALAQEEAAAAGEDNPVVNPIYQKRINKLKELRDAFDKANSANAEANDLANASVTSQRAAAEEAARLTTEWRTMGEQARGLNNEQSDLVDTFAKLGDATSSATEKADAFRHAYDLLFGAVQRQGQATDDYAAKLLNLEESVKNNKTSLDNHSRAGLNNRDAMREALRAIIDLDAADLQNGATLDEVTGKHKVRIGELEAEAKKLGLSSQATHDLVLQYGQIPTNVQTNFTSDGVAVVKEAFRSILTDVAYLLEHGFLPPRPTGDTSRGPASHTGHTALAAGGMVPGWSPNDKADNIPALLTAREYVQPVAAVDYYGVGLMDALRNRAIPKEWLPGYATGGFVRPRIQFPGLYPGQRPPIQDNPGLAGELAFQFGAIATDVVRQQVMDAVKKHLGDGATGVGSEAIKAFIHRMDAAPYIFGAAGPNAWDCSGAAGAVYGLMLGLPNATSRRFFTTFDFQNGAPAHFKPGVGGVYSVGVNPQTHMAGEYGGLKFEAANSRVGIKVGASAQNIRNFQKQFHVELADGGLVDDELLRKLGLVVGGDPSGMTINGLRVPVQRQTFDSGGWLPPGLTLAYNGLGHHEYVDPTPPTQHVGGGTGRGGVTLDIEHFHARESDPQATAYDLDWLIRSRG